MLHRARYLFVRTAAILIFLTLAGATYQGVATALERRQFRHPGAMVDAGGHQLHIDCRGQGSPTVVLEAPATGMSAAWAWVQPDIAARTRACSYDRAGLGWSEAGDRSYDPGSVPVQLHTLLQHAKERGPYVLAGQGLGAAFAKTYASMFGDDISALILVDAPDQSGDSARVNRRDRFIDASPWLARTGILRATHMLSSNASGLPEPGGAALSAFLNRPDHLTRAAQELSRWDEAVRIAAAAPLRPGMRVVRLVASGTDHVALLTDRDQADNVTATILNAVDMIRHRKEVD
jgi:pimeloyl-ACP methyl ester carboxylesterase